MLGLTFKPGDKFTIHHEGESCEVTVTEHRGDARLIFDAPWSFQFLRNNAKVQFHPSTTTSPTGRNPAA